MMRRMRDIQLPLLAPTFFFILVINITDSFTDSFGIVDTLTGGDPVVLEIRTAHGRSVGRKGVATCVATLM